MRAFLSMLAVLCVGVNAYTREVDVSTYLENRIPPQDKRYSTFVQALQLIEERGLQVIVETGTARYGCVHCIGDGCSTVIFGDYARENGRQFYSVDINPLAILSAREALGLSESFVNFVCSDSIEFLKEFEGQIDFLYLDSFDFEINNPGPSQEHHLSEIKAAISHLSPNSVVMIDDCDLPYGGKGKLVIEYLMQNGWIVFQKGYQVIMIKE